MNVMVLFKVNNTPLVMNNNYVKYDSIQTHGSNVSLQPPLPLSKKI